MTVTLDTLDDLEQAQFDAAYQLITSMVGERHPTYDLKRGPVHDLIVYLSAELAGVNTQNADRLRRSLTLQGAESDPTLVDSDTLGNLASNYGIVPLEAASSTGTAAVVVSVSAVLVIPRGFTFTDPAGRSYEAAATFTARTTSGDVISTTDRLLTLQGDGNYAFTITLNDSDTGTAGNIPRLTALTPSATLANFERSYASSSFTGGRDDETATALLLRARTSWTSRSASSRAGVEAVLRSVSGYETMPGVSVVGFGDAEQKRNHAVFPVTMPGRCDAWVRTGGLWDTVSLTKTATLVGTVGSTGIWQFTILRDDAPGFYEIEKIALPANIDLDTNGYTITLETRGYDVSAGSGDALTYLPDITSATEAGYSRYSTATVRFNDTDTSLSGLTVGVSTKSYSVLVRTPAGIEELQDAISDSDARSFGDVLVRGAVPCTVSVSITISTQAGATAPTSAGAKAYVADTINGTGFFGSLTSATLLGGLTTLLPSGSYVSSLSMSGSLRRPDGTTVSLASTGTALTPTTDTANLISSKTVCFFCREDDVTVTLSSV